MHSVLVVNCMCFIAVNWEFVAVNLQFFCSKCISLAVNMNFFGGNCVVFWQRVSSSWQKL